MPATHGSGNKPFDATVLQELDKMCVLGRKCKLTPDGEEERMV